MLPRYFILLLVLPGAGPLRAAVADQVCAQCHPQIARSYAKTAMAQTSGRVTQLGSPPQALGPELAGLRLDLRPAAQGWHAKLSRSQVPLEVQRPLQWFLGSGRVGRSYLSAWEGQLFQWPLSTYTASQRWETSPGFSHGAALDFRRAVEPACLQCHSSQLSHALRADFVPAGISCERCHGPGEQHVRRPGKNNIVQPAKLSPAARDSVCAQCHLTGAARVATQRGEKENYLPGGLLRDFVAVFVSDAASASTLSVTGHSERLAASRCRQASGDQLWCASCHDPHTEVAPAAKAAHYRAKCESCHQAARKTCSLPLSERQARQNDCSACHMPKAPTQGIDHSASTDHAILRRPVAVRAEPENRLPRLQSFWPGAETPREEALAWAVVAAKDKRLAAGAVDRLRHALLAFPRDPQLSLQLAQLLEGTSPPAELATLYEAALPNPAASVNLGILRAQAGRLPEAAELWRSALRAEPHNSSARLNLAQLLLRQQQLAAARAELESLLRFDPDRPDVRRLLAQIQARLGAPALP